MEALFQSAAAAAPSYPLPKPPKTTIMMTMLGNCVKFNFHNNNNHHPCVFFASSSSFVQSKSKKPFSLTVNARKKEKKEDSHSFVPKPDEVTGFFPESVLLKKKEVEEDGELLPEFEDAEERELYESLMLDVESDMDVELLRHYEIMYLIHEKHEEEVAAVNEKVQDFLREKKGRVWRFNDWGMRKLAYKIKKAKNAHYILMNIEINAKYINDFKTMLDKDERVIRHLVIKMDEAITEDCPPPPEFQGVASDEDDEFWDDEEELDEYDDDDDDIEGGEGVFIVDDDDLQMVDGQKLEK